MTRLGRRVAIGLLAASALVLTGRQSQDYTPLATMQAMPESRLPPFAGATLIRTINMPRTYTAGEITTGAYLDREFGTDADVYSVYAYYNSELAPLGWSDCARCGVWSKNGWEFNINVQNPLALTSSEQGYRLVYDEVLGEDTSVHPPPPPAT